MKSFAFTTIPLHLKKSVLVPGVNNHNWMMISILAAVCLISFFVAVHFTLRLIDNDLAPRKGLIARAFGVVFVGLFVLAMGFKLYTLAVKVQKIGNGRGQHPQSVQEDHLAWFRREAQLKQILAFQQENGISDEDLDRVLKQIWTETHEDKPVPWQRGITIGGDDNWWRIKVDWDVDRVKQRLMGESKNNQSAKPAGV